MADVSKLNINGTSYNIKDSTARTNAASSAASAAQSTATNALNKANANESAIAGISATYVQDTETITFEL